MPNGYCGRPPQQDCPHPNACLTCPDFQTTVEFLPVHRQQAQLTRELLDAAMAAGRERLAANHRKVLVNLDKIISSLVRPGQGMPDRIERLRQAAQARHIATLRRAETALRALASRGEAVSLRGLATAAGVSRSWLYRQPELRQEVERLRRRIPAHKHSVPPDQQATVESLRQQLRAYREEIARLRVENLALTDQVAR